MGFEVEEKNLPKKKKKKSGVGKFFAIFFSIIIGIPLLLVGTVYACFYDSSHKEVLVQSNYETQDILNEVLVDSMDNTKTDHTLSLSLKTLNINTILKNVIAKNAALSQFVKNLYVDTATDTFDMVLEADAYSIFKTKLTVSSTFKQEDLDGPTIVFKINNIKLGRINGMEKALGLVGKLIPIPDLSSKLEEAGFRLKIDLENLKMTYKVSEFCEDIVKFMGGSTSDFMTLVTEILTSKSFEEAKEINGPTKDTLFSMSMDIDELRLTNATHGIEEYVIPGGYFTTPLQNTVSAVKSLLDNGKLFPLPTGTSLTEEIDLVAKYIMGGDVLFTSPNPEIERLKADHVFDDLTITIPQYNYNLEEQYKLSNVLEQKVQSFISTSEPIKLTTSEIDKSLTTTTATGIIASFARNMNLEDDDYKVNYVCTDRIGIMFSNETLYLLINLNINGYCGHLSLSCPKDAAFNEFGKLKFNMGAFRLGDIQVSDKVKQSYLSIITDALSGQGMSGIISVSNNSILIDIGTVLAGKGINSTNSNVTFDLISNTKDTDGRIDVSITPKI